MLTFVAWAVAQGASFTSTPTPVWDGPLFDARQRPDAQALVTGLLTGSSVLVQANRGGQTVLLTVRVRDDE